MRQQQQVGGEDGMVNYYPSTVAATMNSLVRHKQTAAQHNSSAT